MMASRSIRTLLLPLLFVTGLLLTGCGPRVGPESKEAMSEKPDLSAHAEQVSPGKVETQARTNSGRSDLSSGAERPADLGILQATSPVRFDDVTAAAGVQFTYHNGEESEQNAIIESLGGGVGAIDFDGDQQVDLIFPGGGALPQKGLLEGRPLALFRQQPDHSYCEVSVPAGLRAAEHSLTQSHASLPYSFGCAVGDANEDGFPDLLVTAYGGVQFWKNQGEGTFLLADDSAGLTNIQFASSAAWGDLDGDGDLDLYVAQYVDWSWSHHPPCAGTDGRPDVCPPREFQGLTDQLFWNDGNGQFTAGLPADGLVPEGKGLGVLIGDLDRDGDNDIYVANDTTPNFLYLNDGTGKNGRAHFEENGFLSGVAVDDRAVPNGSMGVDLGDYNQDGRFDLWVANYEQEPFALYRNDGNAGFSFASRETGISSIGQLFVGFGTSFGDFDSDGDEDLVVSNGHVVQTPRLSPIRQEPLLLINQDGQFRRQTFASNSYFGQAHTGRGLTSGDFDQDGDLDLAISHNNEPVAVLRNRTPPGGNCLELRLVGVTCQRDAVGAVVTVSGNGFQAVRQIMGGRSYLSASERCLHWGLPAGLREVQVEIAWPDGKTERFEKLAVNRLFRLRQGAGHPLLLHALRTGS